MTRRLDVSVGDERGVQVREEGRGEPHKQAEDEALRALLRAALPRRGGLQRAPTRLQGARRERGRVETRVLRAAGGDRGASGRVGHRLHLQLAPSALRLVRPHQAPPPLPLPPHRLLSTSSAAAAAASSLLLLKRLTSYDH